MCSHQNGGVFGLLPSFTVLSSLPSLGAVQIRYFRLILTTHREGPNRPTRKRTLFRKKRTPSDKKRNETYKKRTSFKTKHPYILQIKCETNAAAHKVVRRPHTFRSSSASLVRSQFPSKRKCQTRKRRKPRRRAEGSHVQTSEKWTEDTTADLREHRCCC